MKIVFVCGSNNQTPYSEFIPLSNYFKANGIESYFVLENNADINIVKRLIDNKMDFYLDSKKNITIDTSLNIKKNKIKNSSLIKGIIKKILPIVIEDIIKQFMLLFSQSRHFVKTEKLISAIFNIENPDAIVLYGDRVMGLVPSSIKWMKNNNKAIIDLQIAISDQNFLYSSGRQNSFYYSTKNPLNYIFGKLFPSYRKCFEKECVLFYDWSMIFVLWSKRMLPLNPWYLGQSWADKFLVISKQANNELLNSTQNTSNTNIVGQYSHDLLFNVFNNKKQIKENLLLKYFKDSELKNEIIIFGMPQFYEHNLLDKETSIKEIEYILENLSKFDDKLILLSLHPKMPYKEYVYINMKYKNIKVLKDERLSGTLPVADYFISIFESTINWALMCEIVPIFLDYYELGFDVSKYSAVQNLKEKSTFEKDMQKIFENKTEILKGISKEKELLPPFDGKSGERILTEIRKSINEK